VECRQCGQANPEANLYCGRCGAALPRRAQAPAGNKVAQFRLADELAKEAELPGHGALAVPTNDTAAVEREALGAISGPSILGLADGDMPAGQPTYLYDDESRRGRSRWGLALLLMAAIAVAAYEWRQWPRWYAALMEPAKGNSKIADGPVGLAGAPVTAATPAMASPKAIEAGGAAGADTSSALPAPAPGGGMAGVVAGPEKSESASSVASGEAVARPAPAVAAREPEAVEERRPRRGEDGAAEELYVKWHAYRAGNGVPKNCPNAVMYLNRAARRGSAKAASQLGGLYATGHCVPLDRGRAYEYFKQAQDMGSTSVYVERGRNMMWTQMTEDERRRMGR